MKTPPKEIYFLSSGLKNRLYTSRGYARLGFNSVRYSWGTDAKVYKLDTDSFHAEWEDVTESFN